MNLIQDLIASFREASREFRRLRRVRARRLNLTDCPF